MALQIKPTLEVPSDTGSKETRRSRNPRGTEAWINRLHDLHKVRRAWVKLFDRHTSNAERSAIKIAMRRYLEKEIKEATSDMQSKFVAPIPNDLLLPVPKGAIVAVIMTRAFNDIQHFYASLNPGAEGIVTDMVFIGYSSGKYNSDKNFSDGENMAGKIYIPREDLAFLLENTATPILLVDDVICTGVTVSAIGKSLKSQLEHTGKLYQIRIDGYYGEDWSGSCSGDHMHTENIPILTDGNGSGNGISVKDLVR